MHERACDRHPLQLATRQLARSTVSARLETHGTQHFVRPRVGVVSMRAEQRERQRHVLRDAQVGQHVKRLEHKAHPMPPQQRERVIGERRDVDAVDADRSTVRALEACYQIQERRLADARFADDRNELAGRDGERDRLEDAPPVRPAESLR